MSLTMKGDGEKQSPWIVVPDGTAEEQLQYMVDLFGLDREAVGNKTVYEVFLECEQLHRASYLAAKGLGGRPVAKRSSSDAGEGWPANDPAAQPAKEEAPAEPEHKFQSVLDDIANATSKDDVMKIYLAKKESFADPDVAAAAEAKTKEFS